MWLLVLEIQEAGRERQWAIGLKPLRGRMKRGGKKSLFVESGEQ